MTTRNAAYLLRDLIESLDVPRHQAPETVRGFGDSNDVSAWRQHAESLLLARSVDDHVQGLAAVGEDVSIFVQSVPTWYAAVGMAATPWGSRADQTRRACEPVHMNMLTALAMLIDARPHLAIDVENQRSLADVIEEARGLLADDNTIDEYVRVYLAGLLDRAAFLLDNIEKYGAESLRSVALELGGAYYIQAEREPDEAKKSRWRSAAWGFVGGFMSSGGGETAKALGRAGTAAAKQISGSG